MTAVGGGAGEARLCVLYLIDRLGLGGGSEVQTALNAAHLDRSRFRSVVCQVYPIGSGSTDREAVERLRAVGLTVTSLDHSGARGWLRSLGRLRALARSQRARVVHTTLFQADLLGGIAGKLSGIPVVQSAVNTIFLPGWSADNPRSSRRKTALVVRTYAALARHTASHVVANSGMVQAGVVRHYGVPPAKVSVVYRSVPPSDWALTHDGAPAAGHVRQELGLAGRFPILLNVARIVPSKGQRYLLEAVELLRRDFPSVMLLVVGEQTPQLDLAGMRDELGLGGHVLLTGHRRDVPLLHRLADVGVFPSLYEGFGGALLEACAAGLPCVASRIGSLEEILGPEQCGVLVPPRSAEALAAAVAELVRDRQAAARLGARAAAAVRRRFSLAAATARLEEVYLRLAREAR